MVGKIHLGEAFARAPLAPYTYLQLVTSGLSPGKHTTSFAAERVF